MRHRAHRRLVALLLCVVATGCGQGKGLSQSAGPLVPPDGRPFAQIAVASPSAIRPTGELPSGDAVPPPAPPLPRPAGDRALVATIDGVERRWTLVVPPGTTEDARLPMLIVLHGAGGTGAGMRGLGFDRFAAAAGVVVAYPDAVNGGWNDGRPGLEPLGDVAVDDLSFLRRIVRDAVAEVGVDPARVAVTGHSNGALMAARAACDMADVIRTAVLVSGAGPSDVADRCRPSRPVAMMVVFGTADPTVPYEGGTVAPFGGRRRGQVAPVRDVLALWQTANGCTATEQQQVTTAPKTVVRSRGTGCRADVVHIKVNGGGHEWFAPPAFDTTGETWRFVATHLGA